MEGWKNIEFGKVGTKFFSGGTPSTKDPSFWNGDIQWITSKWLDDSLYLKDGEKNITYKGLENSASKLVKTGNLIVATRVGVGKVCINKIDLAINQDLLGVEIDANKHSPEFIAYQLRTMGVQSYINSFKRGATIQGVTRDAITSIKLNIPQLQEQRKIAYILNTVQKAIEHQDKLISHTSELKKTLMQKIFTKGTKVEKQKLTEIGLLPESWEVSTIGEMYDFTSKPRGLKIELPVPFIPMEIVPFNKIYIEKYESRESLSSGTYVENGDLLLAKITPSFENGKQGIVSIDKPYSYATTEVIPIKEKADISDKFYLFYYLLKDDVRKPLTDKMEGSTGRQRLSKTILEETLIPKPPVSEQKEIARIFLSFNENLSFLQKKKQILCELFKTLLQELMTGERRVNELKFETLEKEYKTKEQLLSMAAE